MSAEHLRRAVVRKAQEQQPRQRNAHRIVVSRVPRVRANQQVVAVSRSFAFCLLGEFRIAREDAARASYVSKLVLCWRGVNALILAVWKTHKNLGFSAIFSLQRRFHPVSFECATTR